MDVLAIAGLAGLILLKEAGVPLPVPGDLVIIGAGATLTGDLPAAGIVLAVILVAGYIGASVQFGLFGSALRRPLLAALGNLGISEARIRSLSERFRSGGVKTVALTRMTPGVRIAVIPAAALAGIGYVAFLLGIIAGNGVFVTAHSGSGSWLGRMAATRHDLSTLVDRATGPTDIRHRAATAPPRRGPKYNGRLRRMRIRTVEADSRAGRPVTRGRSTRDGDHGADGLGRP